MRSAKVIAVVVAVLAGAQAALGCILAGLFELQGFGRSREEPRAGYLALLTLGLVASVLVPLAVWRLLLPATAPAARWIALAAGAIVVLAAMGVAVAT